MNITDIDTAAQRLIDARVNQEPIDSLGPALTPTTALEAYTIDDRVAEISGWPVLGWKVGCTSVATQELLGTSEPFAGRIYKIAATGEPLPPESLATPPYLEGEFAFVIGRSLNPDGAPFNLEQMKPAVRELRPAIEIVGGRFTKFIGMPVCSIIADAGSNTQLVLGEPVSSWTIEDLATHEATMAVDGEVVTSGSGHDVLENPINSLLWLVNHLAGRNIAIHAGQVITTGTATKVTELPAGSAALADFGKFGSVSTSFDR